MLKELFLGNDVHRSLMLLLRDSAAATCMSACKDLDDSS